ncbi:MAG: DUF4384 domain-containing protein [Spirochaetaceae bacterium]|jgi:hypothetical protein|nr:DUF4384 domain-containing protein [Spirochaetaceae bacterium]
MRKSVFFILPVFLVCANVFSQDMDAAIKKAVDELVVRLNAPMNVNVGLISIAETSMPTAFSRYLHTKIKSFAAGNSMYRVVEDPGAARGVNRVRPGNEGGGELTGVYHKIGPNVEVTLYLKPLSGGAVISSSSFSVPAQYLEKMELAILPANNATEIQAREKETIFTALPEADNFRIEAWMDSPSGTYYEGDVMTVCFVSDRSCYYKIYYINTLGRMTLIYPTRQSAGNFLRANTVKEMKFNCIPPYGNETFLLMASEDPFDIDNAEFEGVEATAAAIERAIRGLQYQGQRSAGPAAPVTTARFSYTILPPAR